MANKLNAQKMPQIELRGLAHRARLRKEQVRNVFDAMLALFEEDKIVKIEGFGTFTPIISDLPNGKHLFGTKPNKGPVIGTQRTIRFRMAKSLRAEWKKTSKRKKNVTSDTTSGLPR